jgi:serine/threonine protein kinase
MDVFQQVMDGCQYLEKQLIIHRDIKPVNIFKKGNLWKIGDFGFARYVPYKSAQIQEMYMVGSPLYMPL